MARWNMLIVVFLTFCIGQAGAQFDYRLNLKKGTQKQHPAVTVVEGFETAGCDVSGILKISLKSGTIPDIGRVYLEFSFATDRSTYFYEIRNGDSSEISASAVFGGIGTLVYVVDGNIYKALSEPTGFNDRRYFGFIIDHKFLANAQPGNVNYLESEGDSENFFAQADGPFNLFVSVNKVISLGSAPGHGACSVGIKFLEQPTSTPL